MMTSLLPRINQNYANHPLKVGDSFKKKIIIKCIFNPNALNDHKVTVKT